MSVKKKKIILAVAFLVLYIPLKIAQYRVGNEEYVLFMSNPAQASVVALLNCVLGGSLYSYSTLMDEKRKIIRAFLKIDGVINIFGGVLLFVLSFVRLLF